MRGLLAVLLLSVLGCGGVSSSGPVVVEKPASDPSFKERAAQYIASAREMIERAKTEELMSNVEQYNSTILKLHSNLQQPKPTTADEEYLETALKGIAVKFPLIEDAVTRKIRAVEAKDESQMKSTSSDVEAAAKMLLESCDFAEKILKSI